jgi:ABC-type molybdate transport system substrate-binding protein
MWIPRRSSALLPAALLTGSAARAADLTAAALTVLSPASAAPGASALAAKFTQQTGIAVTLTGGERDLLGAP